MPKKIAVTDAELDIIKVLWRNGPSASQDIFAAMENSEKKSISTLKTLLHRLVKKGAVSYIEMNPRNYLYAAEITENEYIRRNHRNLIDRMFDGSAQNMLLHFVKEEKITKEDLEWLIRQIDEG